MDALVHLGIARELTGKRRHRIFAYDRYVAILSEGTNPPRIISAGPERPDRPRGTRSERGKPHLLPPSASFKNATVAGHACCDARRFAPSRPPCARRNPCPAPSYV